MPRPKLRLNAKHSQQIDVVEVFMAGEAVGQVVFRVDVNEHFAAVRAEEDEAAVSNFRRRSLTPERGDGDGHRQVVADFPQQFRGNHRPSQ